MGGQQKNFISDIVFFQHQDEMRKKVRRHFLQCGFLQERVFALQMLFFLLGPIRPKTAGQGGGARGPRGRGLTLSYSSKINGYLYHQRVSPTLKKTP
jgi:hypothetical protein